MNKGVGSVVTGSSVPVVDYLLPARVASSRSEVVVEKIQSFANLPKGWHYGEGGPISKRIIDSALMWYDLLVDAGMERVGATPSEDGAIVVSALIFGKYTEIISERNQTFTVVRDRENGHSTYKRALTEDQVRHWLNELLGRSWNTFAGFTLGSLTRTREDSVVRRLRILPGVVAEGFQLPNANVSAPVALPYASMVRSTTAQHIR